MQAYLEDLSLTISANFFACMISESSGEVRDLSGTDLRSFSMSEEEFKRLAVNMALNNGKLFCGIIRLAQGSKEFGGYPKIVQVDSASFEKSFIGPGDPLNPPLRAVEAKAKRAKETDGAIVD